MLAFGTFRVRVLGHWRPVGGQEMQQQSPWWVTNTKLASVHRDADGHALLGLSASPCAEGAVLIRASFREPVRGQAPPYLDQTPDCSEGPWAPASAKGGFCKEKILNSVVRCAREGGAVKFIREPNAGFSAKHRV